MFPCTARIWFYLPLYRQHQRLLNSGVELSRSTLLNYMTRSIALFKPIYEALRKQVLQSGVLAMDEVPMKVGRKARGNDRRRAARRLRAFGEKVAWFGVNAGQLVYWSSVDYSRPPFVTARTWPQSRTHSCQATHGATIVPEREWPTLARPST